jgi:hypothetical protein
MNGREKAWAIAAIWICTTVMVVLMPLVGALALIVAMLATMVVAT